MDQNAVYCNIKGLNMHQKFVLQLFELHRLTYTFLVQDFLELLLSSIEFVNSFELHKMDWILDYLKHLDMKQQFAENARQHMQYLYIIWSDLNSFLKAFSVK